MPSPHSRPLFDRDVAPGAARLRPIRRQLLWDWLAARSLARGLPPPVPDHGGMRVDTGTADEPCRHVFAAPGPGLRALAVSIRTPGVLLKLCGTGDELLAQAPPGWTAHAQGWLMTHAGRFDAAAVAATRVLPAGYRLLLSVDGPVATARILADDGAPAAGGHAAEHGGAFVFDRIATAPAHRRRGLASVVMAALWSTRRCAAAHGVLVATPQGRALYEALGWTTLSPYATIALAAPAC